MLTAILLQTPGILLNGRPVAFPFKRADALLYYMLVRRSATRQELISLLWESCDEEVGLKNLRKPSTPSKNLLEICCSPLRNRWLSSTTSGKSTAITTVSPAAVIFPPTKAHFCRAFR